MKVMIIKKVLITSVLYSGSKISAISYVTILIRKQQAALYGLVIQ